LQNNQSWDAARHRIMTIRDNSRDEPLRWSEILTQAGRSRYHLDAR
jgi:hypothetical protein